MKKDENSDEIQNKRKSIHNALKTNKAQALGIAVLLTVNTPLVGCANNKNSNLSANPSPSATPKNSSRYYGGYHGHYGGYYYMRGGSYTTGTWGKYSVPKGVSGSSSVGSASRSSGIGSSSYGRGGGVSIGG